MTKVPTIAGLGCLIATTGIASAQSFDLGDMLFTAHEPFTPANETFEFDFKPIGKDVLGFIITFDYVDHAADSSWASDLELKITTPSETEFIVGQLAFDGGDSFSGSISLPEPE